MIQTASLRIIQHVQGHLRASFSILLIGRVLPALTVFSKTIMAQAAGKDKLDQVKDVDIDPQGRFKYVLVKVYVDDPSVTDPANELSKYVVRGYADCAYHADIYDRLSATLHRIGGLDSECLGGGRILHENKKLTVFGYSQGYGRADHAKAVQILKKQYPDYEITWNNDGY